TGIRRRRYRERSRETLEILGGAGRSKTRLRGHTIFIASRRAAELPVATIANSGAKPSSEEWAALLFFFSPSSPGLNILAPSLEAKERRYSLRSPTATFVNP